MHANILKQSCYVMYFGHSCFWQWQMCTDCFYLTVWRYW